MSKFRLGIIGLGMTRAMYGPPLRHLPGVELSAVADVSTDALTFARETMRATATFESVDDMFRNVKLDGVIVASPPWLHLKHVEQAARSGVAVLVEKPMARSPAEADAMVRVCREAGVPLYVAFNRRFHPALATATQMVRRGELGDVFHVDCIWTSWSAQGDGGWRDTRQTLGGVFQDHGAHTFDLAMQWLGDVETVSAQAQLIGPALGVGREVEDHLTALARHARGTSLHLHSRASHRPVSEMYRLYGTRATLELEYTGDWAFVAPDAWEMRLHQNGNHRPQTLVARRPDGDMNIPLSDGLFAYYVELSLFVEALRAGDPGILPEGDAGALAVRCVSAAYLAALKEQCMKPSETDEFGESTFARLIEKLSRGIGSSNLSHLDKRSVEKASCTSVPWM